MISTPSSREALLRELVRIPSVTGSDREDEAARFVHERLSKLEYYKKNPSHLAMLPVENSGGGLTHTVAARMSASRETKKTVVMIAHYDVVDTSAYGDLAPWAFDPDGLALRLAEKLREGSGGISARAAEDLASGNFIFGRGVMDMKCGLALEMELLRDFDADRELLGVNLIVLIVPDEENTGAGIREGARYLAGLAREEGLAYIAGIDTEPSEPGMPDAETQLVFLGSLGKLLPAFYCRGIESHVGNYYRGISAALMSAHIVTRAEAAPELADPHRGMCQPSWICLRHATLEEGYSVTVPNRSIAYFNCFDTTKTPSDVLAEMRAVARGAASSTLEQLRSSRAAIAKMGYAPGAEGLRAGQEIGVLSFGEIADRAAEHFDGGAAALREHVARFLREARIPDLRDAGYAALEETLRFAGVEPPFVAYGFLPPYNPPVTSMDGRAKSGVVVRAVERVAAEARARHDVEIGTVEFFAGLSDMSFMGYSGDLRDAAPFEKNCPGWGVTFDVPFAEMAEIDMPVMNLGPCGYDAHKKTERLEKKYSLEILPALLLTALRALSEEWDCYERDGR